MSSSLFLSVALDLADRLADEAHWEGDRCTWEVVHRVHHAVPPGTRVDGHDAPRPRVEMGQAGPGLYRGTAGIALALAECVATGRAHVSEGAGGDDSAEGALRRSHDRDLDVVRETATGAMDHAIHAAGDLAPGFYGGRLGVAWAAERVARRLCLADRWRGVAEAWVDNDVRRARSRSGYDLTSGAAGMIAPLLQLAVRWGRPDWLAPAVGLGDRLIEVAHREPSGWSWGTESPSRVRHLCGMAHGAAGVVTGLLELYQLTGHERFRYAARQAMRYENSLYDPHRENWPDLRHQHLSMLYHHRAPAAVKTALQEGEVAPWRPSGLRAWCHGAPGIALARVRAYEILGDDTTKQDAHRALTGTHRSFGGAKNYCLCHGVSGNADVLLRAAETLGTDILRSDAHSDRTVALARGGHSQFIELDQDWPCGNYTGRAGPSLMVGLGGIAMFFLRMVDASIPTVLLVEAPSAKTWTTTFGPDAVDRNGALHPRRRDNPHGITERVVLENDDVDVFFSQTRRIIHTLGLPDPRIRERAASRAGASGSASGEGDPADPTPVQAFRQGIDALLNSDDRELISPAHRRWLDDASAVERARFDRWAQIQDFTRPFVDRLLRPDADLLETTDARVRLHDTAHVVQTRYDWDEWLRRADSARPDTMPPDARPSEAPGATLLYRTPRTIDTEALAPLAATIALLLRTPVTREQLTDHIVRSLPDAKDRLDAVTSLVVQQLMQFYRLGALHVEGETDHDYSPATTHRRAKERDGDEHLSSA